MSFFSTSSFLWKYLFFISIFFHFSCDFNKDRLNQVNEASLLQNQSDCVEMAQKKEAFKERLKFQFSQMKNSQFYLVNNFNIIKKFIENEEDQVKKNQIEIKYNDLLNNVFEEGVIISIENSPGVFEDFFKDFPDLSQELLEESNKNLAFYNLYYELDLRLSTGTEYNNIFPLVEKNMEQLNKYQDEESVASLKTFLLENLENFKKYDCFCNTTAFIDPASCAEIIFN